MKEFCLKFNELKRYKTLSEIKAAISVSFYEKVSYFFLTFLLLMSVGVMSLSPFIESNLNMLMYVWGLLVGDVGLVLLIWLGYFLLNKAYVQNRYYYIYFACMMSWLLLSTLVNCSENVVWIGDRYRHEGFFMFLAYGGIFFISTIVFQEKYRQKLLYVLITISLVMSVLTIIEFNGFKIPFFASDKVGYSAIFHQFNHFGYYLLMSGMCAAGLFVVDKNRWRKWFAISSFSIIIVTLIINDTFGCYLAMIAGLVFLPFAFMLAKKNLKLNYFIPLLLFVVLTLGMNLITGTVKSNMSTLSTDITKIVTQDESSGSAGTGRWVLWINAVEFIKEKPLFGHGLDNLGKLYYPLGVGTDRPHNEYLQHAAHLGIPALIFYLCSLASTFINAFKQRRNLSSTTLVSLCVVAAYLISACFGNTMYYTTPYFVMFLGMSTKIGKSDSLEEELDK